MKISGRNTARGIAVAALVAIGGAFLAVWLRRGPDPSQFADLREPRLTHLPPQRMLVVEATGDPSVVGAASFKQLFSTYFALPGVSRMSRPPAPRARWPRPEDTPKDRWVGQYALPVSETAALAAAPAGALPSAITTWEYGDVAEVLHVGSYSTEQPDIERLRRFITAQGLEVIGDHEEEYVKGPGMIFAGDPERYLTIIRLRVGPRTS